MADRTTTTSSTSTPHWILTTSDTRSSNQGASSGPESATATISTTLEPIPTTRPTTTTTTKITTTTTATKSITTTTTSSDILPISEKVIPGVAVGATVGVALFFFLVWLVVVRTINYFKNKKLRREQEDLGLFVDGRFVGANNNNNSQQAAVGQGVPQQQQQQPQRSAESGSRVYLPGEYGRQFISKKDDDLRIEMKELTKGGAEVKGYERIE
ncbi:hypothetical protein BDR26DRAFT_897389 [Obelidium mucronatum]|nr:hypothetical protein BDR26DRAFT_897389 [Obelidium mucronatum]